MVYWLGYGLDNQQFESRLREQNFLFFKTLRPALKSTQASIQWVPGSMPGLEVNHSLPSISTVKNSQIIVHAQQSKYPSLLMLEIDQLVRIVIRVKANYLM